jgi:transposase-like protein
MCANRAAPAPPFCPNPACRFHRGDKHLWRYVRNGFFTRQTAPHVVQRLRCVACRRNFSTQTFRTTYWLKRPDLLVPVFHLLVSCAGFRQMSRMLGVAPQTPRRLASRLGRHCQLFHEEHRPKGELTEPLTLDSFESFEFSQYYPTSFHVAVGQKSHYFHGFTESERRRSGTMTPRQRKRRQELEQQLGRPDPRSIELEVEALLRIVAAQSDGFELHTDQHKDYPRAIRRLAGVAVDHRTISSRAARVPQNPLFPVNLLDLLIRHSGANHKRETIAFSKRRQSAAERLWVFLAWRNYVKSFSEREPGETPAMRLGLARRPLSVEVILVRRLFLGRISLPQRWEPFYRGLTPTRRITRPRTHERKYAF